jgi:hypothetical protein
VIIYNISKGELANYSLDCTDFCTAEGSTITSVLSSFYSVSVTSIAGNVITMHVDSRDPDPYQPFTAVLTITLGNGEIFTRQVNFVISQH